MPTPDTRKKLPELMKNMPVCGHKDHFEGHFKNKNKSKKK